MKIDFNIIKSIKPMNKIYFDTYNDKWENIEISLSNDGSNCYINLKNDRKTIIKGFKLTNNSKVDIYCEWTFFKRSNTNKFMPRPKFYKFNGVEIKETNKEKIIIDIDKGEHAEKFWEMLNFISGYKDLIELGEFENKYKVLTKEQFISQYNNYEENAKLQALQELIENNNSSYKELEDLLNTSKKRALKEFESLLNNNDTSEKQWQNFFEVNPWIFAGISLKLVFRNNFMSQVNAGVPDSEGKGSPEVDLVGNNDYLTLIELKKANTLICSETKKSTARTNTWSFSNDFIDGISQCLAQKNSIQSTQNKNFIISNNKILHPQIKDPKVVFIIGNRSKEFPNIETNIIDKIKSDTFELFRRNNKNIDIITYDELYERASYIVNEKL